MYNDILALHDNSNAYFVCKNTDGTSGHHRVNKASLELSYRMPTVHILFVNFWTPMLTTRTLTYVLYKGGSIASYCTNIDMRL